MESAVRRGGSVISAQWPGAPSSHVFCKYDMSGALIGPQGGSVWLNQVPEGIFETLMWVSNRYDQPTIVITENGCDMLGEDEPRDFDSKRFKGDGGGKHLQGSGQDNEASLESLLALESEDTKALLTDDFR
eukprot:CAMPEP_0114481780 /NCGR_PEP_ID=MMETSP0104-20121206/17875_1 /TAXON_ID=37642 ORGANISM="Paraphysomonas imperforata, Strain PA2" /NCGR_SAMPLE_ID=MMETSP0104 /ASSEMBLY_ACC=CAM_ASM_000202 /LENGTH=130 /DNA_ID=CAMNT_0001657409 /DNA_START=244 /DNA_END=636 /DNA_ORIENTATION=-